MCFSVYLSLQVVCMVKDVCTSFAFQFLSGHVYGFIYLAKYKFLKKTKWNPPVDMLSIPRMKEQEIMSRIKRTFKHLAHAENIGFRVVLAGVPLGSRMKEEERKMRVRS